jgi:hypothetical protein
MAIQLAIDGHFVQHPTYRRLPAPADAVELVRWACFLDQGDSTSGFHESAVDALVEAADGDADLLHAAWTRALRARRDGVATRSAVELVYRALERAG